MRRIGATIITVMTSVSHGAAHELTPIGPEFIVTSTTANDQFQPWADMSDDGDIVLSYSTANIFGRRLDRNGAALGADFSVNPTFWEGDQNETFVAVDPITGDFLICYSDRHGNDGDLMGAFGRFYRADGVPYTGEMALNTQTIESQFEPHATFLPNSRVFVAWADAGTDGSVGCIGRIFDRFGAPITGEFLLNEPNSSTQLNPSVSASRDGRVVCAFEDASGAVTAQPRDIVARLFDQNGAPLGPQFIVSQTTAGMQRDPIVAMDADGDFVVVWHDEEGIDGDGFGVLARLFDKNGNPKTNEFVVSQSTAGTQRDPHVDVDYVGNFVVTWESNHSGDYDVFIRRFDRAGNPLSNEIRAHETTGGDQTYAKSVLSQSGERVFTIWHSSVNGDSYGRLFRAPSLEFEGTPSLTNTITLDVLAPGMSNALYVVLPSLGTDGPIAVNGGRSLHLAADALMLSALEAPESSGFTQIMGTLDPTGHAAAGFMIPNDAMFYDLPVHFGVITLAPGGSVGSADATAGSFTGVEFLSETITLNVNGPLRFHPGQVLVGEIDTTADEDRAAFEAVKGEKIKLTVAMVEPALAASALPKFRVEVRDEHGKVVKKWKGSPPSTTKKAKKAKKLQFKVKKSGRYELHVFGVGEGVGHYRFDTSHKMPKSAKASSKKAKVKGSGFAVVKLLAVADTTLGLTVTPKGGAAAPAVIEIIGPDGGLIDPTSFASGSGEKFLVSGLPLAQTGLYQVRVPGKSGASYQVDLTPTSPFGDPVLTIE